MIRLFFCQFLLIAFWGIFSLHTSHAANIFDGLNDMNSTNRELVWRLFSDNSVVSPGEEKNEERKYTFEDIAGSVPEDVQEIVSLVNASSSSRFAGIIPKGILLYGSPGTGKTSMARAIAGEVNAPFFAASATEFIEIYAGSGPLKVRQLFDKAKAAVKDGNDHKKKAVIFIDEIDAIGGSRGSFGDHPERRSTLNELLKQMDGFERYPNIMIIAATNTPDFLDPALLRPGRFDRLVEISLPDFDSRCAILKFYLSKQPHKLDDIQKYAEDLEGASGAEIESLVKEAAIHALRNKASHIDERHMEEALKKISKQRRFRNKRCF
jgi:cell division protease FtsH